jgi:predicted transcriptional regulator
MKTAISIPDEVFKRAERIAEKLGVSRSELFTRAMQEYLGVQRDANVTASYDEAFADAGQDDLIDFRREAAKKSLLSVEWSDK